MPCPVTRLFPHSPSLLSSLPPSLPSLIQVFAPTDEAFNKLEAATLNALLADKEKLTSILTYHVVSGERES